MVREGAGEGPSVGGRSVNKLLVVCVAALVAGCNLKVNVTAPTAVTGSPGPAHQPGMWKSTTLVVSKYRNALFRDKQTGKQLEPAVVETLPVDQVALEAGDFDELAYNGNGRLRYAFYGRGTDDQPYVVEREMTEADFDALDSALYDDRFFSLPAQNWDPKVRLPLYVVHYEQGGKAFESSFTPTLAKLGKFAPIVDGYMTQMGSEAKLPKGASQIVYGMSAVNGTLSVTLTNVSVDADGDAVEKPIPLAGVKYDIGQGPQPATLLAGGKEDTFTLPQPQGNGAFLRVALSVTPKPPTAAWDTVIPIRTR